MIGNPYSYCLGKRYAKKPSTFVPACVDNNSSLNALDGCYDIYGNYSTKCMQVCNIFIIIIVIIMIYLIIFLL